MPAAEATLDTTTADILAAWRTNDQINQYLIDHLTDEAWTAKPPGGKGRTIAAIFAQAVDKATRRGVPAFGRPQREGVIDHALLQPAQGNRITPLGHFQRSEDPVFHEQVLPVQRSERKQPEARVFIGRCPPFYPARTESRHGTLARYLGSGHRYLSR